MRAEFVELPAFARHRADYLDDDGFGQLQALLIAHPTAGDVIPETGRRELKALLKQELEARK